MNKDNYYILTGPFGSGKTTLLRMLSDSGMHVFDEPGRRVLADQRRDQGNDSQAHDHRQFVDQMLTKALDDYDAAAEIKGPVIFDRGIPDNLAYAFHFGFDHSQAESAAGDYRYNGGVFYFPAWEAIYTCDHERKASFEIARDFGERVQEVYLRLGYQPINVPCVSVEQRLEFIIGRI